MARAAVRRSAGRCESFRGRVSSTFLLFLARKYARTRADRSYEPLLNPRSRLIIRHVSYQQGAIAAEPPRDVLVRHGEQALHPRGGEEAP